MISRILLFIIIIGGISCSPKVTTKALKSYQSLQSSEDIKIFQKDEKIPTRSEQIGTVKVGDAGMTVNCSYPIMINLAKKEARNIGGNGLQITEHFTPDLLSTCHRIKATILKLDNNQNENQVEFRTDSISDPNANIKQYADQVVSEELDDNNTGKVNEIMSNPVHKKTWRFAIQGGYSKRTGKLADDLPSSEKTYLKGLLNGYHFGADISYVIDSHYGFGLKYSRFKSHNSGRLNVDGVGNANVSDVIKLNYIGPSFVILFPDLMTKNQSYVAVSMGYLGYRDAATINNNELTISANSVGLVTDIGYDIALSKSLAIGFQVSLTIGTLTKYTISNGYDEETIELEEDEREDLTRIDFSVGIRF